MGPKDAPCEHPSPAKTFAPVPSAFAFSYPRSHFPRIAFRGPRGAIGISQQQLSTMGYPRKSYPHCCSPPCAKRSRPRACARGYNISFARRLLPGSVRVAPEKSPRLCDPVSRAAVRRVGAVEAKGGRPLAQCRTMPLVSRITVRKGGSAPGQPRPSPCVLPAAACLRPRPRPLMGTPPPQAGGKTTEWRTAAPQRPHTERSAETILAQFAYHDAKAHKALCTICNFRLHALQAFAQLFHSLAQIAPQRTEKSTNRRSKA